MCGGGGGGQCTFYYSNRAYIIIINCITYYYKSASNFSLLRNKFRFHAVLGFFFSRQFYVATARTTATSGTE